MIRHEGDKWVLYSHDGDKVLGRFDSEGQAGERERQVQYFKSRHAAMMDDDDSYDWPGHDGLAIATASLAFRADELKIIKKYTTGGGLVEMPLLRIGEVNLSKTASRSAGIWTVTAETLNEMVGNFGKHVPLPVGHYPHVPLDATAGEMPAFLEAVSVRGDTLYGHISVADPALFDSLVKGTLRGFSGDFARNAEWPQVKIEGWEVYGGVLTNRPAVNVSFRPPIAAAVVALSVRLAESSPKGEHVMADQEHVSLAVHESKVKDLNDQLRAGAEQVVALTTRLQSAQGDLTKARSEGDESAVKLAALSTERDSLRAQLASRDQIIDADRAAVKELNKRVVELTDKVEVAESANLAASVLSVIDQAVQAGVPPAVFDGHKADPASWMKSNYANLDAFTRVCASLSGMPNIKKPGSAGIQSGHDPAKGADDAIQLTAAEKEVLDRVNATSTGANFIGASTEAEARKRFEQAKQRKSA